MEFLARLVSSRGERKRDDAVDDGKPAALAIAGQMDTPAEEDLNAVDPPASAEPPRDQSDPDSATPAPAADCLDGKLDEVGDPASLDDTNIVVARTSNDAKREQAAAAPPVKRASRGRKTEPAEVVSHVSPVVPTAADDATTLIKRSAR
ncbi:hypothetical protein EPK99_04060 [Neorhizobium lilium]|uniref:Uncharacterized protein n=1 Tax=Neorhizobium lilium TaxID=2503024 RepID=A0A3S3VPZ1_9HYPH|nr:hypothetical protein [Neorhizobium lilium]RWX81473.1 hypothetical protein EPK99_04060 [Neorhizobium lilium]